MIFVFYLGKSKLEKIYSLFRKHQIDKLDDLILIKGKLEKKVSETNRLKTKYPYTAKHII